MFNDYALFRYDSKTVIFTWCFVLNVNECCLKSFPDVAWEHLISWYK